MKKIVALVAISALGGACDDLSLLDSEDLGFDVQETGPDATANYQSVEAVFAADGDDFYRMPWPFDARLSDDGLVDLSDFPDPGVDIFRRYVAGVEANVRGFSLMPVIYVRVDENPIPSGPPHPTESLLVDGSAQLIALGDRCGDRVPIEVAISTDEDDYINGTVLTVAPVPGFPLRPSQTYAFVALRSLGNPDGFQLEPSAELEQALAGQHVDPSINQAVEPLMDCLADAELELADIAAAAVFTTQDPITEVRALRDFVWSQADAPQPSGFAYSDTWSRAGYETYLGTYETPMFQDGLSPYAITGGAIHFEDDGSPIVQREETVPFTVAVPTTGEAPYRLLIWVDGTGADDTSWVDSEVTQSMLRAGFVVAGYTPQFHGSRATPGSDEELHSFNYLNPDSFRNTFRQQIADTSYFVRLMTESRSALTELPEIDDSRIAYAGQSQGALIGAMLAAVESEIDTYMLNGVGGYLSITAVERVDPIDIPALIADIAGIDRNYTRFHPLMALAQLGGDVSDPQNFAREWVGWPGNPDGVDMLIVNGVDDHTTPVRSMNSIAVAGNVSPLDPPGWNIDPFEVWNGAAQTAPLVHNRESVDGTPRTHAAFLSGTTGHFTIYRRDDAQEMAVEFLRSGVEGNATLGE